MCFWFFLYIIQNKQFFYTLLSIRRYYIFSILFIYFFFWGFTKHLDFMPPELFPHSPLYRVFFLSPLQFLLIIPWCSASIFFAAFIFYPLCFFQHVSINSLYLTVHGIPVPPMNWTTFFFCIAGIVVIVIFLLHRVEHGNMDFSKNHSLKYI